MSISSSYHSTLNDKLEFEFVSYSWSQDHFASSFLWLDAIADRLHLHETSQQNLSWSSSTFWVPLGYQLNPWWEMPSLPLDELCYHWQHSWFPFNTNLFMFCVVPWDPCYPTYVMFYLGVLPSFLSRRLWEFHHLLRILGMVILLTITILSWYPCCF